MIKWVRFILRLLLLAIAVGAGVLSVIFFYQFHTLTIDQVSELLSLLSHEPILTIAVGIGLLLFALSILGLIMLLQYQVWRYPFSIFLGYIAGAFIYYQFYLMHPFEENILQLNDDAWYYPFILATALLLRAILGFKIPRIKNQVESTT
ncbi:hypothetical protein [Entomomonas asaccharolytica]|uniref:Uncharacterized protein n=1 Tax=Entomomonas asaccharolytica TaxID=2785331 RepID=A0A974NHU2_9GAMM|nr:hypothetical protein [Entomomonas asaccharolytica]QQP86642.1 hypothetical protein JHT90_05225 [Entomomonas asaccharolytica]